MNRRDPAHDRPSKAATTLVRSLDTEKALAKSVLFGGGESGAAVFDAKRSTSVTVRDRHDDLCLGGAVAYGVVDQVANK